MTARISDLMSACTPAGPAAAPAPGEAARQPGMWTRGNGAAIRMTEMNPYHRENAIRKARAAGDEALAAELEASRPKE